jgi:hypothetical protein
LGSFGQGPGQGSSMLAFFGDWGDASGNLDVEPWMH